MGAERRRGPVLASVGIAVLVVLIVLAAIFDLGPLAALVNRYLDARDRGIDALEAGADAAREEDGDEYRALKRELARSQHERLRLARRIGFSECSRPLAGPAG